MPGAGATTQDAGRGQEWIMAGTKQIKGCIALHHETKNDNGATSPAAITCENEKKKKIPRHRERRQAKRAIESTAGPRDHRASHSRPTPTTTRGSRRGDTHRCSARPAQAGSRRNHSINQSIPEKGTAGGIPVLALFLSGVVYFLPKT